MWCTPCQDLPTKRNQISHRKTLWLLPCDLTRISYVSVRCGTVKQALLLKQVPQTTPLYRRFMAMADARRIKELRFLRKRKRRKMTWASSWNKQRLLFPSSYSFTSLSITPVRSWRSQSALFTITESLNIESSIVTG